MVSNESDIEKIIIFEKNLKKRIAYITFNRPEKLNAILRPFRIEEILRRDSCNTEINACPGIRDSETVESCFFGDTERERVSAFITPTLHHSMIAEGFGGA